MLITSPYPGLVPSLAIALSVGSGLCMDHLLWRPNQLGTFCLFDYPSVCGRLHIFIAQRDSFYLSWYKLQILLLYQFPTRSPLDQNDRPALVLGRDCCYVRPSISTPMSGHLLNFPFLAFSAPFSPGLVS